MCVKADVALVCHRGLVLACLAERAAPLIVIRTDGESRSVGGVAVSVHLWVTVGRAPGRRTLRWRGHARWLCWWRPPARLARGRYRCLDRCVLGVVTRLIVRDALDLIEARNKTALSLSSSSQKSLEAGPHAARKAAFQGRSGL